MAVGYMLRGCRWCDETLHYAHNRGWVHRGGGWVVMACGQCHCRVAFDPPPAACPDCGERRRWRLDHTALPDPVWMQGTVQTVSAKTPEGAPQHPLRPGRAISHGPAFYQ